MVKYNLLYIIYYIHFPVAIVILVRYLHKNTDKIQYGSLLHLSVFL